MRQKQQVGAIFVGECMHDGQISIGLKCASSSGPSIDHKLWALTS